MLQIVACQIYIRREFPGRKRARIENKEMLTLDFNRVYL